MNYLYDDFGSKISVNLIGPFEKSTNETGNCMLISTQIDGRVNQTHRFDIQRTGGDQIKPDISTFVIDLSDIDNRSEMKLGTKLNLSLQFTTNAADGVVFQMFVDTHSLDATMCAICGGIILILLNVLIISEVKVKVQIDLKLLTQPKLFDLSWNPFYYIYKFHSFEYHSAGCPSHTGCNAGSVRVDRYIGCIP